MEFVVSRYFSIGFSLPKKLKDLSWIKNLILEFDKVIQELPGSKELFAEEL